MNYFCIYSIWHTLHKIGQKRKIQLKRASLLMFSFSSSNFLCKSKVVRHWAWWDLSSCPLAKRLITFFMLVRQGSSSTLKVFQEQGIHSGLTFFLKNHFNFFERCYEVLKKLWLWNKIVYRIVASTNTCYYSENQIFYSLE